MSRRAIAWGLVVMIGLVVGAAGVVWFTLCWFGTGGHCWEYVRRSLF